MQLLPSQSNKMDANFTLVKNQNSISFYIEEAALLVTNFALFTLFLWKYPQMFNKNERRIAHMHDFPKLLRICRSCWLYLKYSTFLNITSWINRILKGKYVIYLCKIPFSCVFLWSFCMSLEVCWWSWKWLT